MQTLILKLAWRKVMLHTEQLFGGKAGAGAAQAQSSSSEVPGLAVKSLIWQSSFAG